VWRQGRAKGDVGRQDRIVEARAWACVEAR